MSPTLCGPGWIGLLRRAQSAHRVPDRAVGSGASVQARRGRLIGAAAGSDPLRTPRKRKAVPVESPAVVRKGAAKPATPAPADDDRKSAIVTAKRRRSRFRRRTRRDAGGAPAAGRGCRCALSRVGAPGHRQGLIVTPGRHWRSYGTDPLPTGAEALDEPLSAFPSWFMRITCDRCGKDRMLSETRAPGSDLPIREIIKRMRHDGCGGRPGRAELLTGIEGASSRPVRRILLLGQ